jgi:predicted HicB family RNase H-like nuclease
MARRKVELDEQLVVRVPRALREAAEAAAERDRRPLTQYLRNLIEDGVAGHRSAAA